LQLLSSFVVVVVASPMSDTHTLSLSLGASAHAVRMLLTQTISIAANPESHRGLSDASCATLETKLMRQR
jgi:hypothetical protein